MCLPIITVYYSNNCSNSGICKILSFRIVQDKTKCTMQTSHECVFVFYILVRMCTNRLELIQKAVDARSTTYKNYQRVSPVLIVEICLGSVN